jgi:hypothetical protein
MHGFCVNLKKNEKDIKCPEMPREIVSKSLSMAYVSRDPSAL